MTRAATVLSMGSALPDRVVGNDEFPDSSDEWIRTRTGIGERRFAGEGETTSTLAAEAGRRALAEAGVEASTVDVVIVATATGDRPLPSTAAYVQAALGASGAAFDLGAACSGFVHGLALSSSMIQTGTAEVILLIGAECLSRFIDPSDRSTAVLFGDGAGAAVLGPSQDPGVLASLLDGDGSRADQLSIPAGGARVPATDETVRERDHTIHMPDGREIFRRAVVEMTQACEVVLGKAGLTADDVDLLVPHQANARIVSAVASRLGVPEERAVLDIETVGNTSAASIPIALDRAWRAGRVAPGDLVLTVAFGAGFAWGANLIRWSAETPR